MFGVTEDDIAEEAKNLVNRRLFISAYAEANNIEVTEDEYVNYVNEYADVYKRQVELMCDTDLPISDIIAAVGYENNSYFHRVFKERYG